MPITSQTVILAAGMGSRLRGTDSDVPKPLIEVAGLPLIGHAIAHAEASGCHEAIVVVGYQGTRVRAAAASVATTLTLRFIEAPDPSAPNGHSLAAVEGHTASRFYLQMVDHVFDHVVLPLLDGARLEGQDVGRLLVDRTPKGLDLDDATRVRLAGPQITAIGKGLDPWDAIDTGCFILTPAVFEALGQVRSTEPKTVSAAMRRLVERERLFAAEIGDVLWVDVDTPADRAGAERLELGTGRHAGKA
jgi:1L-myo-inositol 1-phosphate cytidylyltransferase